MPLPGRVAIYPLFSLGWHAAQHAPPTLPLPGPNALARIVSYPVETITSDMLSVPLSAVSPMTQ